MAFRLSGLFARLQDGGRWSKGVGLLASLDSRTRSPHSRAAGYATGALLFGILVVVSWKRVPDDLVSLHAIPLLGLLFIGIPLTVAFLALEYHLSAQCLGIREPLARSMRVAVMGAAANMLPIPGALLVKAGALRQAGATTKRAGLLAGYGGVMWLALSALVVGVAVLTDGKYGVGVTLGLMGLTAAVLLNHWMRTAVGVPAAPLRLLLIVILAKTLTAGVTTYLALASLAGSTSVGSAIVLSAAVPLSSAAGFFPGGLGLREALSGLLATFTVIDPGLAVLGAALSRVLFVVGLGMLWLSSIGVGAIERVRLQSND